MPPRRQHTWAHTLLPAWPAPATPQTLSQLEAAEAADREAAAAKASAKKAGRGAKAPALTADEKARLKARRGAAELAGAWCSLVARRYQQLQAL